MNKPKRGGSRPGAGRRKKPDKRVNLTVSLPPATKAALTSEAASRGVSTSELVRMWTEALIPRTQSDTTE